MKIKEEIEKKGYLPGFAFLLMVVAPLARLVEVYMKIDEEIEENGCLIVLALLLMVVGPLFWLLGVNWFFSDILGLNDIVVGSEDEYHFSTVLTVLVLFATAFAYMCFDELRDEVAKELNGYKKEKLLTVTVRRIIISGRISLASACLIFAYLATGFIFSLGVLGFLYHFGVSLWLLLCLLYGVPTMLFIILYAICSPRYIEAWRIKKLESWAERGDWEAQIKLRSGEAQNEADSIDDEQDDTKDKQLDWLEFREISRAAELGSAKAQFRVGLYYERGEDMPKPNPVSAARWYLVSAIYRHAEAKKKMSFKSLLLVVLSYMLGDGQAFFWVLIGGLIFTYLSTKDENASDFFHKEYSAFIFLGVYILAFAVLAWLFSYLKKEVYKSSQ